MSGFWAYSIGIGLLMLASWWTGLSTGRDGHNRELAEAIAVNKESLATRDRTITDLRAALETADSRNDAALRRESNLWIKMSRAKDAVAALTAERDMAGEAARMWMNSVTACQNDLTILRDELARWKRPRDHGGRFVTGEAGPAMAERL